MPAWSGDVIMCDAVPPGRHHRGGFQTTLHRFRRTAAVLAATTVLPVLAAAPAQAAGRAYVALGDSYSSGTGTRSYLDDGTSCQRSVYAYPSLIASSKGYALNFRACSGATVADVTNQQLGALGASTAYASMTVGGNDAGFSSVLTECAKPAWASNCNGAIDRAQSIINNQLPARLATLYAAIRERAPKATVVVGGYPRLFNGAGYAPLIASVLTGATVAVTTATTQLAEASAGQLAAQQRPHAEKDRTIRPKQFRAPDLSSPEMQKAAARAGVDLNSRASIDEADRKHAAMQAAAR